MAVTTNVFDCFSFDELLTKYSKEWRPLRNFLQLLPEEIKRLKIEESLRCKEKFLFIILPELYRRYFNVFESEVTHGDKKTTLGNIFNISKSEKESGWNGIEGE